MTPQFKFPKVFSAPASSPVTSSRVTEVFMKKKRICPFLKLYPMTYPWKTSVRVNTTMMNDQIMPVSTYTPYFAHLTFSADPDVKVQATYGPTVFSSANFFNIFRIVFPED